MNLGTMTMSEEQTTAVPATDYSPIDSRSSNLGNAVENRSREQIKQDNLFQPAMPSVDDEAAMFDNDPFASVSSDRYRQLEANARKARENREYNALQTDEERELFVYKKRIAQA